MLLGELLLKLESNKNLLESIKNKIAVDLDYRLIAIFYDISIGYERDKQTFYNALSTISVTIKQGQPATTLLNIYILYKVNTDKINLIDNILNNSKIDTIAFNKLIEERSNFVAENTYLSTTLYKFLWRYDIDSKSMA